MRIAFLVQAHANVEQLVLLTKTLRAAGGDVYIHFDAKSSEDLAPLRSLATLVARQPVYHGGISQVKCTLEMLSAATQKAYDYYFLLSGQCFPVKPASWLMKKLEHGGDFINFYPMPRDAMQKRLDRLQYYHFEKHSDSRLHAVLNRVAKRLPKRNFINGLNLWPYAGSNWWCLRHSTVSYVLNYVRRSPDFVGFMDRVSYPDEVYFQSIISTMGIEAELSPALFRADFDSSTGRPRVYQLADIELLSSSDVFVARKFDLQKSPEVLKHFFLLLNN